MITHRSIVLIQIFMYIYMLIRSVTQDLTLNAQNSEQRGRMDDMIHKKKDRIVIDRLIDIMLG